MVISPGASMGGRVFCVNLAWGSVQEQQECPSWLASVQGVCAGGLPQRGVVWGHSYVCCQAKFKRNRTMHV